MKRPELMVTNGELSGRRFSVKEGGLRLGRSSSNDVHIPDEELSRNHCLFEPVGEGGIRLTDLASANGTYVNGRKLCGTPVELHEGDVVEAGKTTLKVVGEAEPAAAGAIDLGLDGGRRGLARTARRRSPLANILWGVAVLAMGAAAYLFFQMPADEQKTELAQPTQAEPVLAEAHYEKVAADENGIFRYEMALTADGVLTVTVDDVPKENRHLTKSAKLSETAVRELGEILSWKALRDLDREYVGAEPDPPALNSWELRAVYTTRARSVRVANAPEPEAFRAIRERLEAFASNELRIWALQYSREKLISLAEESLALARSKWNDRDVKFGNLFGAITAYKAAISYLETVNPKPACAREAQQGLDLAQGELDTRYRDQRFRADQAINLGQWDAAQRELKALIEMIPDRNDERQREATAKLIDIEKRMKGGK